MVAKHLHKLLAAFALLALIGAGWAQEPAGDEGSIVLADVGFEGPESVVHYEAEDVYFVSNVGSNAPGAADGFISRVSPDGTVLELKWIDGQADGVEMDAPKGLAIVDGRLYAADYGNVRVFDPATGEQLDSVALPDATFPNGVAPHPEDGVLVTDTGVGEDFLPVQGAAAVYHVTADGTVSDWIRDEALGLPNGIEHLGGTEYAVVTFADPGSVVYLDDGEVTETLTLEEAGNLDGVVQLEGGELLVTSWTVEAILSVAEDGTVTTVLEGYAGPADMSIDSDRQLLLIPLLSANEVHFVPLGGLQ